MKLLRMRPRSPASWFRAGTTLMEAIVALAVLGAVVAGIIPVLSRTSMIRDQIDRREFALDAIANLLERASRQPQLTEVQLREMATQLTSSDQIPHPEWNVVIRVDEPGPLQRVEATLSWQHRDQIRSSVSLVRWFPGGQP